MPEIIDWDEMRDAFAIGKRGSYAWFRTNTRDGFMVQYISDGVAQVIDHSKTLSPYIDVGDIVNVTNTCVEVRHQHGSSPKHRFTTRVVMLVHPFQSPISYPFGEEE
tara:strand:+ start:57 stop:377 length:321 start_codon:yes stop_codon:yes gene_type:complete